ncbi:hypothetical protein LTS18_003873 [Coniosporium uncinatum]|uniref:Uncharacterized protein n=1 Tax=Coniosporium uncinatum TaxID=93489 RepID=A0ACC3DYM1_9PEZI|nr:hypothetical protein LTS18_003873 [Coniosporium uncinatum]
MSDTTQNKKRKRDEASSATGTVPSSRKTAAPKPSTAPTSSHLAAIPPQQTEASQQGPRPLQTARQTKAGLAKMLAARQIDPSLPGPVVVARPSKAKRPSTIKAEDDSSGTKGKVKTEEASKLEKITDEGAKNGRAKKEPKVKAEKKGRVKRESSNKPENDSYAVARSAAPAYDQDMGQITGIYNIEGLVIKSEWSRPSSLRLALCRDASNYRVWASFDWGP